jgi:hypothetical protein
MQENKIPPKFNPMYNRAAYQYLYGHKQQYGYSIAGKARFWEYDYKPFFLKQPQTIQIDKGPQTVEQILDNGYMFIPRMVPETAVFSDKKHTSWLGLDDVLAQIRRRENIYNYNMTDILWQQCYAFDQMAAGGWPADREQEDLYRKRLQELAAEERHERVSLWRDVSRLRQQIPESIQNYLSLTRRMQILDDEPEEGEDTL